MLIANGPALSAKKNLSQKGCLNSKLSAVPAASRPKLLGDLAAEPVAVALLLALLPLGAPRRHRLAIVRLLGLEGDGVPGLGGVAHGAFVASKRSRRTASRTPLTR